MSTQQWPSTQITLFEKTCQSAWLDAETTTVDKKRVNSCALKHPLFWGGSATNKFAPKPRKCSLWRATTVMFSNWRLAPQKTAFCAVFWKCASHEINYIKVRGQRSLKSFFLHCCITIRKRKLFLFQNYETCNVNSDTTTANPRNECPVTGLCKSIVEDSKSPPIATSWIATSSHQSRLCSIPACNAIRVSSTAAAARSRSHQSSFRRMPHAARLPGGALQPDQA